MHRNIKLLALFNFFTDLVFYAPIMVIYFTRVSGSYTLGMSVLSITFLSAALFEIPTGIFSDMIGRKKTIICGVLASIASLILYALGGSYPILVFGGILEGLARSFYSGNNDALLYDTLTETNQHHQYHHISGKLRSLFQIALAVSAVIGGIVANWSFALVMWISVLPKIAMLIISLFLTEPKVHSVKESSNVFYHLREALAQFKTNAKLRYLTFSDTIGFALGESAYLFRSVFVATLWPLWAIGFSNFLSNVGAALSFYFSGKIIDRFKPFKVLSFEIIFNRIVNFTALLFPTVVSPALMGMTSLTYGAGSVASDTLLQKEFTSAQRATMGSLNSLFGSIGFGIASIGLGITADHFGPVKTLLLAHLLLLTPLWFYRKIFSHEKG